jgi:hypothetical protein
MSPRRSLSLTASFITVLAGCQAPPQTSATRAEQATLASCRERADRVHRVQNPQDRLTTDQRDSPQSASYVEGITTRGLGERYAWDTMVSNCVRDSRNPGPAGANASTGPTMEPNSLTP